MRLSVVLSTYNRPRDLELVLWGYTAQSHSDFELVVADDGSTSETAQLIDAFVAASGREVLHVRHDDDGFRKTEILNRAIVACAGDYLLFSDGDCIPRRDLVETHVRLARPGRFLSGGYLKLSAGVSAAITVDDVMSGRVAQLEWLRARGWRPGRKALRLTSRRLLRTFLDTITPTGADFNGNNASVWRDALEEVNGFEGEMGYGGLDKALGYRLTNAGVTGLQVRHRAVCLHLHHDRPYRDPVMVKANRERLERLRRSGETRARQGIAELGHDPSLTLRRVRP